MVPMLYVIEYIEKKLFVYVDFKNRHEVEDLARYGVNVRTATPYEQETIALQEVELEWNEEDPAYVWEDDAEGCIVCTIKDW